jgi:hypothetical protein
MSLHRFCLKIEQAETLQPITQRQMQFPSDHADFRRNLNKNDLRISAIPKALGTREKNKCVRPVNETSKYFLINEIIQNTIRHRC